MALSVSTKGTDIQTIDEYIKLYKETDFTYDDGYLDQFNAIHILDIFDNFLNDYNRHDEGGHTIEVALSNKEKDKYRYNPKMLSRKVYNTPDMWQIVLRANGLSHPGQLELDKPLYLPDPEALEAFLNRLPEFKESIGGQWVDVKGVED